MVQTLVGGRVFRVGAGSAFCDAGARLETVARAREGAGMSEQSDGVDFALAAYREDGEWQLQEIASPAFESVDSLSHALRRLPGEGGAVGMVAVDEDFFVIVRVTGPHTRVLLSDVTAADEWEIAQSVIDFLGLPPPEDDDVEVPAGDLGLLDDLGLHAIDLGALLDDVELYPDEMLSEIARRLGFGELFDDAVGLTSA
jgi:putative tRNA adenosine deaminase-associated protein